MKLWPCLGFLAAAIAGASAVSEDPATDLSNETIPRLIDRLASANREPRCDPDSDFPPRYPAGYSRRAQLVVHEARNALIAKGIIAFPYLIKHVDDRRYSDTEHRQKTLWVNVDVGYVCRHIIAALVEVYQPVVTLMPTDRYWVPFRKNDLEKWWFAREGRSLRDIQLEAVRWAHARQLVKPTTNAREQREILDRLDRVINRLESSDKAIRCDWNGDYIGEPDL